MKELCIWVLWRLYLWYYSNYDIINVIVCVIAQELANTTHAIVEQMQLSINKLLDIRRINITNDT